LKWMFHSLKLEYKYHIYIERKIVFNLKLKYKKSSLNHKNM